MPPSVRSEVDQVGTSTVVRIAGILTVTTAPAVRLALVKCLVGQPDALVVDLSELEVGQPAALTVFAAVARQAAIWPGTPLLLCGAAPEIAARLSAGGSGHASVHASASAALAMAPRRPTTTVRETLLPVAGAAHRSRRIAEAACLRWNLAHLIGPARVVACELVTNAAVHAQTMIDLQITPRRRYLLIAVRDGSREVPRLLAPDTPSGMRLVDGLVRRWGSLPADDGKVVWAMLDKGPPGPA
jgi:anti-anti-sigma regulatory factor